MLEEGTIFVRGQSGRGHRHARLPAEAGEEGKLIVQVEDTLVGKQRRIPVDMVILSAGLEPRHDAKEMAKRFGISCSSDGWFIERHPKLDPVATMTEGVFIAGCVPGPERHPGLRRARARRPRRASWAASSRRRSRSSRCARSVDEDRCSGCRICNDLCPFNAIVFHEDGRVTEVNPALCQGCGTCVAACPAGAISGTGFSDAQILAQIEGLLTGLEHPVAACRRDGGASIERHAYPGSVTTARADICPTLNASSR